MKSLLRLLGCLLDDSSRLCATTSSRDLLEIETRVEHEGLSFLTITLPRFCQGFERCLETGEIDSHEFVGFKTSSCGLPRFLGGFLSLVFDGTTGKVRKDASSDAVFAIRQVTLFCKRILVECTDSRKSAALDRYISVDSEVVNPRRLTNKSDYSDLLAIYDRIWSSFTDVEFDPRHGPGIVADGLTGNSKFNLPQWPDRLDKAFPILGNARPGLDPLREGLTLPDVLSSRNEHPVKVCLVPKTQSKPRVIACEPSYMQFAQQGVARSVMRFLESHPYTSGHVNFRDQSINRSLAQSGVSSGYATIDLSDASDRVHSALVWDMLRSNEILRNSVFACRSSKSLLPDGRIHVLRKFASMGSALCFPMEAIAFWGICVLGILRNRSLPVSTRNIHSAAKLVYVYGDDIIVPSTEVESVLRMFHLFGMKHNLHKTFYTGRFRESCGGDYFDGRPVTPVYLRRFLPRDRHDAAEIMSAVSLGNQLYDAGYWSSCKFVRSAVEKILGRLPHVSRDSSVLGWHSVLECRSVHGWDKDLHSFTVRSYSQRSQYYSDVLSGYAALLKCLITPFQERKDHLTRSVRPHVVSIKRAWALV